MGDLNLTPGQPKGSETILSEEIWEKVLMNLTDPSDVLNAGKTCVQFQRILQSKTTEAYLAKALPFLMDYVDSKSILKCRSVSKGWMGVVDNFFKNYFLGRTTLEPRKVLVPFPVTKDYGGLYPFGTEYYKERDHERFVNEMKDHPRNPFIGRTVHFRLIARQDFRAVYNFFEIFGKHIWTLELDILYERFSIRVDKEHIFPFIIRDVFKLAPNLKNLYIKGDPSTVSVMRMNQIHALNPPRALEKLEISVSSSFLPFYCVPSAIEEVEKAIILRHSNSKLRVLHTKTLDHLQNLNWPNLKELHFMDIERNRVDVLDLIFRNLRLPKLEFLSIGLGEGIARYEGWKLMGQKTAFRKLFQALEYLSTSSPNLKTLRFGTTCFWDKDSHEPAGFARGPACPENIKTLKIPEETIYSVSDGFLGTSRCISERLNLATASEFELSGLHATSDYSFLLRFPHVENIHVYRDSKVRSYRSGEAFDNEIVEVHKFMYSGRMYESNIWKLLPNLKVFSYGERVYKRSSYERRLAK